MRNIWKSVRLDFSLIKPYGKTICFTMVLPVVFAAVNRSLMTGISFAMCFIAMTTGYTFSIAEKNDMERLYGILPVRKGELVIGRYVFVMIMGLTALVCSLIIQPVMLAILGENVTTLEFLSALVAGIVLFALYTVFQLPGYYRFGSIRGRVFMYIPVAGFLGMLFLTARTPAKSGGLLTAVIHSPILLMVLAVVLVVVAYVISILVSVRIVQNKEM
ncbi:MAG: ABC-2 transporter permease [Lachnospiraceae bacterium]|nr:ABC-2 transporter permease [Lachnospiraceae bacterium]